MIKQLLVTLYFLFLGIASASDMQSHQSVTFYTDVPIGVLDGTKLSINIALPEGKSAKPRPVVLMIHGGGFISGNKDAKNPQIKKLAKLGYVSASAMYRLSPQFKFPSQIDDIKLAIRFLKANASLYNLDPKRIIVSGSSAGSYLAVMAGVTGNSSEFSKHGQFVQQDSSVRAVAAQSAPIADFSSEKYQDALTVQRLTNQSSSNFFEVLTAMSPKTYLDKDDPPFFLSHGDSDPIVSVDMTREFVTELESINHPFVYYEVKNGTHSFSQSAPEEAKQVFSEYLKFLRIWAE